MYVPEEWYKAVEKANKWSSFNRPILLTFKDLQHHIVKKIINDDKDKVNFNKTCAFKFIQESSNIMFIKHLWNQTYTIIRDLKIKYVSPIPLNPKKLSNLQALLKYIPPIYHRYYKKIGVTQDNTYILHTIDETIHDEAEHFRQL